MTRLIHLSVVLSITLFFLFSGTGICQSSQPQDLLKSSIDRILEVLRDPGLKAEDRREDRRDKLRTIANQRFDYRKMSQLSLGKHWNDISDKDRDEFMHLFSKLLEDTYMSKIETYTDEKVVFVKERVQGKKAQVDTRIITQSVEIPINYRMYNQSGDNWMVYDMVIEGVSMVGNYRSQFGQILEKDSFEDLKTKLRQKDQ